VSTTVEPAAAARPRRAVRPAFVLGVALGAVVVLGIAAILVGGLIGGSPGGDGAVTLTAPAEGRPAAALEIVDGVTSVRLKAGSLGDDLYRISVPRGSGVAPRADRDGGNVRLYLEPTRWNGPGIVDIAVNSGVAWTIRLDSGVREATLDLSGGKVDGIDLAGGASRIEVALPVPSRVVPIRETGGVDRFVVRVPAATPLRVQVGSGAGQVTVGGTVRQGVAPGQVFTANGWGQTNTGVDVQAQAGVGALTVVAS
jgi:hypothetical protein